MGSIRRGDGLLADSYGDFTVETRRRSDALDALPEGLEAELRFVRGRNRSGFPADRAAGCSPCIVIGDLGTVCLAAGSAGTAFWGRGWLLRRSDSAMAGGQDFRAGSRKMGESRGDSSGSEKDDRLE